MIRWLFRPENLARYEKHQFWLVFGVRWEKDLYYHNEFQRLAREHANFHYLPTLSRENQAWSGATGYVQEHVRKIAEGRTDMDAYICGLSDMVKANRDQLKELGWDRKAIVYERFD
jgi:NAD(P)H-flavin reductase